MTRSVSETRSKPRAWIGDLVGGFVAGLYSVPEGIGYAQLGGVNPMYGIYSGVVPVAVSAALCGSVLMMSTLTSAIALTMGGVLSESGIAAAQAPQAVFTITLLVGVFMTVLGLLRWGKVVNFVSNAVMTGFVMGVAILILVGKFDDIFGYKPAVTNKVVMAVDILLHPGQWNLTTTAVGVGTIAVALALKAVKPLERYALVIVVVLGTFLVWAFAIPTTLISDTASIPSGLSAVPLPTSTDDLPDLSMIPTLLAGAFSITLVALAQGAGIRPAFPNPDGSRSSSSRDFLGQGVGNLAGSLFQATPSGGSLSRTAVSADGGARRRLAGYVAAVTVLLLVVLLSPVVGAIPEAVIGGLLFVIGVELVRGRMPDARLAWRAGVKPMLFFLITLVATLTIPLQWAIIGGAVLSLIAYIASSSTGIKLRVFRQDEAGWLLDEHLPDTVPPGEVTVLRYVGADFFAETSQLLQDLPDPPRPGGRPGVVVLDLGELRNFSSTALKALQRYHDALAAAGQGFVLVGVTEGPRETLRRTGLLADLGPENILVADPHVGHDVAAGRARGAALLAELTGASQPAS